MNPSPNRNSLLADVLAEAESDDFRAALLEATLRKVRRRRLRRNAVRTGTPLLAVMGLALFAWLVLRSPALVPASSRESYATVHTQPLSGKAIVTTQKMDPSSYVESARFSAVVHTGALNGGARLIDDAELLALAAPRSAVLVRVGPQVQTLIFVGDGERSRVD